MLSIPKIPVGRARVSWHVQESNGALVYTITGPPPVNVSVTFNAGMLVVALLADGENNLGDIYDILIANGFSTSDPVNIIKIFQTLEKIGAITMDWHIESDGPLRHVCYATECGHCCQGHLIGPLSQGEIDRLTRMKWELEQLEPDLPDDPAVMEVDDDGQSVIAVNTSPGRCVFLLPDRHCSIHRHFGLNQKPLICRLFPLRVIETEDGFRVGISYHCTLAHRSFQSGRALTPQEAFAEIEVARPPGDIVGLDPSQPRSFRYTETFELNQHQEAYVLTLLSQPGLTFGELICSSDGTMREGATPSQAYLSEVARRLRRFPEVYEISPLLGADTDFGAHCFEFLDDLAQLSAELPAWREPEPPLRDYLVQVLRSYVYLRESITYPQVEIGVHGALIGFLGALWTAEPWLTEEGTINDQIGQRIAIWLRFNNVARSVQLLFGDNEDYQSYRSLIGS